MGSFVSGNTPLPALKGDATPINNAAVEVVASDINNLWSAAGDLRTHGLGFVSVLDFGAVGDGVTDDAPAIRSALGAAAGRRVIFPPGTYLLNSFGASYAGTMDFVAALPSNVHLYGEPGAKLKLANGLVGSSLKAWKGNLFLADTKSNIAIEGLEVDFNGANNLCALLPWTCYGLYAVDTGNIVIRDCYWHDTPGKNYVVTLGAGATATPTATGLTIENCEFKNGGTSLAGNTSQDDFSAIYSTNIRARVSKNHIHHDLEPRTFSGGVEMHASEALLSENLIERSYPATYVGPALGQLTAMQVVDNKFLNCVAGVIFSGDLPSAGEIHHVDIANNQITLKHWATLDSTFVCCGIFQTAPGGTAGLENTDWTNAPPLVKYLSITGNTIESLNGTEAGLSTQGIVLVSVFMASILGNEIYGTSSAAFMLWGSPYSAKHVRFADNVCVDFGSCSNGALPRMGVGLLLGGSSTTPAAAAYAADDIVVENNTFVRSSLVTNSGMVFSSFDAGTTLTNWVCHDNVARNLSGLVFGSTVLATPVTDSFDRVLYVTTTPVTADYGDTIILVNVGSAATINIPAAPSAGKKFIVKDVSGAASSNHITVAHGGSNIDGSASNQTISSNYGTLRVVADGTDYWIV